MTRRFRQAFSGGWHNGRRLSALMALLLSASAATGVDAAPRAGQLSGDVFNASPPTPLARFGASAAGCGDPQIAVIEQRSGATARVFPPAAGGTNAGKFGRWLETSGNAIHTGVCRNQPGSLVMFVLNGKVEAVNQVADDFFASGAVVGKSPTPGLSDPANDGPLIGALKDADTKTAVERCKFVHGQQGSLNGFGSCGEARLLEWCRRTNDVGAGCDIILAQADTGPPNNALLRRRSETGSPDAPAWPAPYDQIDASQKKGCEVYLRPTLRLAELEKCLLQNAHGPGAFSALEKKHWNMKFLGPTDFHYNCYAYAIKGGKAPFQWTGPRQGGNINGDQPIESTEHMEQVLKKDRWVRSTQYSGEKPPSFPPAGKEMLVIYAKPVKRGLDYQHAALVQGDRVTAKMGALGTFRFDSYKDMEGAKYGRAELFYFRDAPR